MSQNAQIFLQNPLEIQNAAAQNGFGIYYTRDQMKHHRQAARLDYLDFLIKTLTLSEEIACRSTGSDWEQRLNHIAPANEPARREFIVRQKLSYASFRLSYGHASNTVGLASWLSPFNGNPASCTVRNRAGQHPVIQSLMVPHDQDAHKLDYRPEFIEYLHSNRFTERTFKNAYDRLESQIDEDSQKMKEQLAENSAYIDLIAIQLKIESDGQFLGNDRLDKAYFEEARSCRYTPTGGKTPGFDQFSQRADSISLRSPQQVLERLCGDIIQVKQNVIRIKGRSTQK